MNGRRRPDTNFGSIPDDPQAGDYWKYLTYGGEPMSTHEYSGANPEMAAGNLEGTVWGYFSPDGNGMGTLVYHTVREHEDGTISVKPGDGSSNSIKHTGGATHTMWHGYIYKGVWTPC